VFEGSCYSTGIFSKYAEYLTIKAEVDASKYVNIIIEGYAKKMRGIYRLIFK
jgi:hypothetical protein